MTKSAELGLKGWGAVTALGQDIQMLEVCRVRAPTTHSRYLFREELLSQWPRHGGPSSNVSPPKPDSFNPTASPFEVLCCSLCVMDPRVCCAAFFMGPQHHELLPPTPPTPCPDMLRIRSNRSVVSGSQAAPPKKL